MNFKIGDIAKIKDSVTDEELSAIGIKAKADYLRKEPLLINNVFGSLVEVVDKEQGEWTIDTKYLEQIK